MLEEGRGFVAEQLLEPLGSAEAVEGSPYLNGLAQIATEMEAHRIQRASILLIGDGLAVEQDLNGRQLNLYARHVDEDAVLAFASLYGPLKGSCVILLGSGADADVSDGQHRSTRRLLDEVLTKADARFVSTLSSDVPWDCAEGTSR
jgi:hypothetical protein